METHAVWGREGKGDLVSDPDFDRLVDGTGKDASTGDGEGSHVSLVPIQNLHITCFYI